LATVAAAVVAVVLGFALVPLFGGVGAACALLAANLTNFALVYRSVRLHVVEVRFLQDLFHPLLALAAATAVFWPLHGYNLWLAAGCACLVYCAALACTQGRQLWSMARVLLQRRNAAVEEPLAG
jgi:O-antigen/teichoic acid export membrane protein